MANEFLFDHNALDKTSLLNRKDSLMFTKGILSGGLLSAHASLAKVTLSPFTLIGNDGLIISTSEAVDLDAPNGEPRVICCRLKYRDRGVPEFTLHSYTAAQYATAVEADYIIKFGTVSATAAPPTAANIDMVSYGVRDDSQKSMRLPFRGTVATVAELPTQTTPKTIKDGDCYLVIEKYALYVYKLATNSWVVEGASTFAPIASPTFTGVLTAPLIVATTGMSTDQYGFTNLQSYRRYIPFDTITVESPSSKGLSTPGDPTSHDVINFANSNDLAYAEIDLPNASDAAVSYCRITDVKVGVSTLGGANPIIVRLYKSTFNADPTLMSWTLVATANATTSGAWGGISSLVENALPNTRYKIIIKPGQAADQINGCYVQFSMVGVGF